MIKLCQEVPRMGLPNVSPASMKLETWLRITEIPYQFVHSHGFAGPKGKIPWIEDGDLRMGDSTLILGYLIKQYGKDPDDGLSAAERAISLAFRRMMKENFYWIILHDRYKAPGNWERYRSVLLSLIPEFPVEQATAAIDGLWDTVSAQMHAQGIGRHTDAEVHEIGMADLKAVSDFLADKPFFMGDRPTTADATIYAYVANMIDIDFDYPVKDYGLSLPNLVNYCKRMKAKYYPELA